MRDPPLSIAIEVSSAVGDAEMRQIGKFVSMLALVALALPSTAFADCRWARFHFMFGTDVPHAMATADSGRACELLVRTGRTSEFSGFTVSQQPAHGHVTVGKNIWDAWVYTSAAGFRGTDSFVGTITGHDRNFSGATNVTVFVDVQ
jgi:hypothetical protein